MCKESHTKKGGGTMFPNVRAEIERAGLTLGAVAEELGITASHFSLKMTGKYQFTVAEAKKIKAIIVRAKKAKGITMNIDLPLDILFEEAN